MDDADEIALKNEIAKLAGRFERVLAPLVGVMSRKTRTAPVIWPASP